MRNRFGLSSAQIRELMRRQEQQEVQPPQGERKLDLNKTEKRFLDEVLMADQTIVDIWPHGIRLVLGYNDRYEPDFLIMRASGLLEIYEVKAEWSDGQRGLGDSREKAKTTATLFPFSVTIASLRTKKNGGGWMYERFEPIRRHIENRPASQNSVAVQAEDA